MRRTTWSWRAASSSRASLSGSQRSGGPSTSSRRICSAPRRAARLAGDERIEARGAQRRGEALDLGRLAGPLAAFERDQPPRTRHPVTGAANRLDGGPPDHDGPQIR